MKEKEEELAIEITCSAPDSAKDIDLGAALIPEAIEAPSISDFPDLGKNLEVQELIGQGGMGSVYKVKDHSLDRIVAVKVLKPELSTDAAALKRFKQEAEAAKKLDHPHLATVFDYVEPQNGTAYLVMEYVDGISLADLISKEERLNPKTALNIFLQVCEALAYAHAEGIIHRDIKPTNILLSKNQTSNWQAKIVDFGIAKVMPAANRETHNLTKTGDVFGSPNYMSPEQCLGFMLDQRSDIYSLGCTMYEVLTGSPPFSAENPIQMVMKQVNEDAPLFPTEVTANKTAGHLQNVVMRCLEKDQEKRYQEVDDITRELNLISEGKAPAKYVRRKAAKAKFTTVQTLALFVGTFLIVIYGVVFAHSAGIEIAQHLIQWLPAVLSIIGAYVFLHLGIEKLSGYRRGTISQASGLTGLIFTFLGIACLSVPPAYLCYVFAPKTLELYPAITSVSILANCIAAGLAIAAIVARLMFRSAKRIKLISLSLRLFLVATFLMGCEIGFFPKHFVKMSGYLAESTNEGLPQLSAPILSQLLQHKDLMEEYKYTDYTRKIINAYARMNQPDNALYWEKMTSTFPKESIDRYSDTFKNLQNLKALNQKIAFSPNDSDLYIQRGKVLEKLVCFREAMHDFDKALALAPENLKVLAARAAFCWNHTQNFGSHRQRDLKIKALEDVSKIIDDTKSNITDFLILRASIYQDFTSHNYYIRTNIFDTAKPLDNEQLIAMVNLAKADLEMALKTVDEKPEGIRQLYQAKIYQLLKKDSITRDLLSQAHKSGFPPTEFNTRFETITGVYAPIELYEQSYNNEEPRRIPAPGIVR